MVKFSVTGLVLGMETCAFETVLKPKIPAIINASFEQLPLGLEGELGACETASSARDQ